MKSNMKYLNYILIFFLFYYGYDSYAQSDSIVSVSGEVGGFNSSLYFLNESGGTTRFPRLTDAGERLYYEPVVSTDSVPAATVGASTAIVYGNILFNGWYETVLEQGFQISTTDDFSSTITYQVIPGAPYVNCNPPCAENVFSYFFTGLTAATTYFVRAYAINDKGVGYGNVLSFLTPTLPTVTTNTVSSIVATTATCGGNVSSDGGATVTARGVCWSTSHNPTISNSKTTNGTGTGSFTSSITGLTTNTTYYVRAYATNSVGTAYGAERSFTTLSAGTLPGLFSVSSSKKVRFSQGNLQYTTTGTHTVDGGGTETGTFRFAAHQYDYIGKSNKNVSSSYTGYIDLLVYGSSGYNNRYPYAKSSSLGHNLTGSYANYDWGIYNAISNGGNQPGLWRTLTKAEWVYLFNTRSASTINGKANARYAEVKVNGTAGIILFPDSFTWPQSVTTKPTIFNTYESNWNNINYTTTQWGYLETAGAVFLPAAGYRTTDTQGNTSTSLVNSGGYYWSSTFYQTSGGIGVTSYYAYDLEFKNSQVAPSEDTFEDFGLSIRLVKDN